MGRPLKEAAYASSLAPALVRCIDAAGCGDAGELLAVRCGLDRLTARHDSADITASALASMLAGAAEVLAEPHLGLRLPSALVYRRYDGVALALRAAATPGDVFDVFARYAALLFPQLEAAVERGEQEVLLRTHVEGHARGLGLHVDEYVLALALASVRRGGTPVVPTRVWLSCARPRDLAPMFLAFWTRDIDFGADDTGLAISPADAARELPHADPALAATAEHLAAAALAALPRTDAFAATVASRVLAALERGEPASVSIEAVSEALHMSARTLQRRLDDEGARFSEIVDSVRERVARRLLADPSLALGEIAFRAGFSDLATFSRAFKRWTGVPPGAFRRR